MGVSPVVEDINTPSEGDKLYYPAAGGTFIIFSPNWWLNFGNVSDSQPDGCGFEIRLEPYYLMTFSNLLTSNCYSSLSCEWLASIPQICEIDHSTDR